MSLPFKVGDLVNIWIIGINKEWTYKILDIKDNWLLLNATVSKWTEYEYNKYRKYHPEGKIEMSGRLLWVPVTAIASAYMIEEAGKYIAV